MSSSVSNKEALKDKIHDIHNFLRNNGAGYGMNALKVFNILYGLKKIEENGLLDKVQLKQPECAFSYLLQLADNDEGERLASIIFNEVLDSISASKLRDLLFYEIPKNIRGSVFVYLILEIDRITVIEQTCNVLLSGKIYEYFIGRDESAISELGAYFTDRHIVDYILGKLNPCLDENGRVPTMIDMFGGSGGFTTGYIDYLKSKYPTGLIDWSTQLSQVHHYDMNEDVIKSAGLELFCLTGVLPNMNNLKYKNSFTDEFNDQKFMYPLTNPPYGGDKIKKSDSQQKIEKVKEYLERELATLQDQETSKRRRKQLEEIKAQEKLEKRESEKAIVCTGTCSARIQKFAKDHDLKGNDKESCSLMLLMDILEVGGTAIGVLKEGVFSNRMYKDLRKCLVENYNVREIISVPQDQFENTKTKTSIVIFDHSHTPENSTSEVTFRELVVEKCNEDTFAEIDGDIVLLNSVDDIIGVHDPVVSHATRDEILKHPICSLSGKHYSKKEIVAGEGYTLVKLSEIANLENGRQLDKKNIVSGPYPVYGGGISPVGFHNTYNNEDCTIVAGTGNCGFVQYNKGPFWASQCFTIKAANPVTNLYLFAICKSMEQTFREAGGGSVQKFIRASQFKEMLIPIPLSMAKQEEWVGKIYGSYTDQQEKQQLIKQLEQDLIERIRQLDCQEVAFDDVCITKRGKALSKDKFVAGPYPVIGGGTTPTGFHNEYNFESNTILCSSSGTAGHISRYNTPIWASDCFAIIPRDQATLSNDYLYYMLLAYKEEILQLKHGSAQPHLYPSDLTAHFKIRLPKNRQHMEALNAMFQQIVELETGVQTASHLFKQYLIDLKREAIYDPTAPPPMAITTTNAATSNSVAAKQSKRVSKATPTNSVKKTKKG